MYFTQVTQRPWKQIRKRTESSCIHTLASGGSYSVVCYIYELQTTAHCETVRSDRLEDEIHHGSNEYVFIPICVVKH